MFYLFPRLDELLRPLLLDEEDLDGLLDLVVALGLDVVVLCLVVVLGFEVVVLGFVVVRLLVVVLGLVVELLGLVSLEEALVEFSLSLSRVLASTFSEREDLDVVVLRLDVVVLPLVVTLCIDLEVRLLLVTLRLFVNPESELE